MGWRWWRGGSPIETTLDPCLVAWSRCSSLCTTRTLKSTRLESIFRRVDNTGSGREPWMGRGRVRLGGSRLDARFDTSAHAHVVVRERLANEHASPRAICVCVLENCLSETSNCRVSGAGSSSRKTTKNTVVHSEHGTHEPAHDLRLRLSAQNPYPKPPPALPRSPPAGAPPP